MDKIKITVNGKTFEAEGKDLMSIIDKFLNESEDINTTVPKPYKDYKEYLSIKEFNPNNCTSAEQSMDLVKKLKNRLDWINNHPGVDMSEVTKGLEKQLQHCKVEYEKSLYVTSAIQTVIEYLLKIKEYED